MWPLITQNVRPPKCRHRLPKMSDHPKCRHRKLKMLVPTTQNVSTDNPKCRHRKLKMSAPTTLHNRCSIGSDGQCGRPMIIQYSVCSLQYTLHYSLAQ